MKNRSGTSPPAAGMADGRNLFVGTWEKIARAECDEKYPQCLRFTEQGLYFEVSPKTAERRDHPVWDTGRFKVTDPGHVMLSTSYDEEVVYGFKATSDTLTFEDPDGCEFGYRRAEEEDSGS